MVLVGDRGMITQARIDDELKPAGLDWITSLRAPSIKALAEDGALQLDLFDERDMAAITSPDYPDERLIVCRNPDLANGIYIVRTSLPATTLDNVGTVAAYKSLALAERAFRSLKTVDLQIRPLYHWLGTRVRAHVFLCMLSYHVEWHLRARLAPMLYDDDDRDAAAAERTSIVAKAARSPAAQAKQTLGLTDDGLAVHSFHSLLADLATLTRNEVVTAAAPDIVLTLYARPTAIQQKAFDLLAIDPARTQ